MVYSMKILVLSDAFWPDRTGGISKSLLTEVEGLVDAGHDLVVVTRRLDAESPAHERRDGYHLFRYDSPPKERSYYQLYPLYSVFRLGSVVDRLHRRFDFDIGYVHNPFQAAGLSRADAEIPYSNAFHAPTPQEIELDLERGKYGWKSPLVELFNGVIERTEGRQLEQADGVLVRSGFMRTEMFDRYAGLNRSKVDRIPLCVDTDRFEFEGHPRDRRAEIDLPADRPVVLTVRRLVARMGIENLIRSISSVREHYPNILLVIGGKGYLRPELESAVHSEGLEDNVEFVGFIPESDLHRYYAAADLFAMPTEHLEGFGLSTIESLSCGTPVVATPVGANPEVVGGLEKELLARGRSAEFLEQIIRRHLAEQPSPEFRRCCREYVELNFAVDAVVPRLETHLGALVEGEPTPPAPDRPSPT